MIEFVIYTFVILYVIIFSVTCGGFNFRTRYAYKVSDSVFEFIKNYFWSYFLTYKQIRNGETFIPEVNDKLEKLLSHALIEDVGVGYSTNYSDGIGIVLRIQKGSRLDNSSDTVHFSFQAGLINGKDYILTPSVFFLAQKVYEKLLVKEKTDDAEQRKRVI